MRNPGYGSRLFGLCPNSLLLILEIKISSPFFENLCSEKTYPRFSPTPASKWMREHRFRSHSLHFSQQPTMADMEIEASLLGEMQAKWTCRSVYVTFPHG
ncbi:MAG TPA: hypothetical protein VF020_16585 [Chthoniobacterales bacterium]